MRPLSRIGRMPLFDCGPLDRGIVGAVEDQPIDRPVRHQQFGDRAPPAIAGAAAFGATLQDGTA